MELSHARKTYTDDLTVCCSDKDLEDLIWPYFTFENDPRIWMWKKDRPFEIRVISPANTTDLNDAYRRFNLLDQGGFEGVVHEGEKGKDGEIWYKESRIHDPFKIVRDQYLPSYFTLRLKLRLWGVQCGETDHRQFNGVRPIATL